MSREDNKINSKQYQRDRKNATHTILEFLFSQYTSTDIPDDVTKAMITLMPKRNKKRPRIF